MLRTTKQEYGRNKLNFTQVLRCISWVCGHLECCVQTSMVGRSRDFRSFTSDQDDLKDSSHKKTKTEEHR